MGHYACDMRPEWFAKDDKQEGLYKKYEVKRLGDAKGKHADCEYFVLDLEHDPHAKAALRAYIRSCKDDYPELAKDLKKKLKKEKK